LEIIGYQLFAREVGRREREIGTFIEENDCQNVSR
jgi:hypothetical protein